MLDQVNNVPQSATEVLGDLAALAEQLGGTDGLQQLSLTTASLGAARVQSAADLARFLDQYSTAVLLPRQLPAVAQAYEFCVRGQLRELVALDQEIARLSAAQPFAKASAAVGRTQLRRLRSLRGERLIPRYLAAVEAGEAKAWHTLVFGLVLAVYSLPLRQGLMHFAHQTIGGFIESARREVKSIGPADAERLLTAQTNTIKAAVDRLLALRPPIGTDPDHRDGEIPTT
jgi:urease accessory protein UreF